MSKRSTRQITLVLLASTSLALAACKDEANQQHAGVDDALFKDRAACEAVYPTDDCVKNELFATEEHIKTAPKYANQQECEAVHGSAACTPVPKPSAPSVAANGAPSGSSSSSSSTNSFMPFMMGYMMGNAMGGARAPQPVYSAPVAAGQSRPSTPSYATAGRTITTPLRAPSAPSSFSSPSSRPSAPAATSGVARGGFGSSAVSSGSSASS